MKERFLLENNEAASNVEAAFIFDTKSGLRAQIIRFRTLKQLDAYQPSGTVLAVRNLPILLEAMPNTLTAKNVSGIMNRMVNWYYHTQLNPSDATSPPAGTPPVS